MGDDKLVVLNLCEEAMKLSDDDFQIFISNLKKDNNPLVRRIYTYLVKMRGA